MKNDGGGGWSLQGPDPYVAGVRETDLKAGYVAGVAGDDEEGRSEGYDNLGRSSAEPGDGGWTRETKGSDAGALIPCRKTQNRGMCSLIHPFHEYSFTSRRANQQIWVEYSTLENCRDPTRWWAIARQLLIVEQLGQALL
ncbi:hypothetical protein ZWY2020_027638 [Hordeum vulgare]|nr:hypothetical protein ZWY2020_027638 [Hordeum vulgare]